jgi:hypothetical protein
MPWEKPKYLRADVLLKEFKKRVSLHVEPDISEYYSILTYLEEDLIIKLADKIKKERSDENDIKPFGS